MSLLRGVWAFKLGTMWSINGGVAGDSPETLCFFGKKDQIGNISRLGLCRAGSIANLVFLQETPLILYPKLETPQLVLP